MRSTHLGILYLYGIVGVPRNYLRAHMWFNVAASKGNVEAQRKRDILGPLMTPSQLAEAQALARGWKAGVVPERQSGGRVSAEPAATGSGFAVTSSGIIVTNNHVVEGCSRLATPGGQESLRIIARDSENDFALLQSALTFGFPAVLSENSTAKLGESVVAAGYPLLGLLASSLNVTTGTVSALAGPQDDIRLLQITAPVQPGNSGGPLLDNNGNVIGVIVSKLDAVRMARITGDIPQNVNFAIKTSVLRGFLESNGVAFRSSRPMNPLPTTEVSEQARQFTVAILCWK
jgi:S1-C subfamily serine protease